MGWTKMGFKVPILHPIRKPAQDVISSPQLLSLTATDETPPAHHNPHSAHSKSRPGSSAVPHDPMLAFDPIAEKE
jgi:hypothetical protein